MNLFAFLSGVVTMGFVVAGFFFLRFHRQTRDILFLAFAVAFWLIGLVQALLALTSVSVEERSFFYLIRLAAFLLILAAIWWKNKNATRP